MNPEHAGSLVDEVRNAFEDAGGTLLRLTARDWERFLKGAYAPKSEDVEAAETVSVRRV